MVRYHQNYALELIEIVMKRSDFDLLIQLVPGLVDALLWCGAFPCTLSAAN